MATQDERRADPTRQGVGMRLKAAREGNKATVSAWETGIGDHGIYRLRELSKLYGVSTDALLWEDGLTNEAMQFAAQFDSLTEKQRSTFRAVWLAFVQQSTSDHEVEAKMPITKPVKQD